MATYHGRATYYSCCANDGESCWGNCNCTTHACEDSPHSHGHCCTACCEGCNNSYLAAAAFCSVNKECYGTPEIACNTGIKVEYCGNSHSVTVTDQLSPCNSGSTFGDCTTTGKVNTYVDLVPNTFAGVLGANPDDGPINVYVHT